MCFCMCVSHWGQGSTEAAQTCNNPHFQIEMPKISLEAPGNCFLTIRNQQLTWKHARNFIEACGKRLKKKLSLATRFSVSQAILSISFDTRNKTQVSYLGKGQKICFSNSEYCPMAVIKKIFRRQNTTMNYWWGENKQFYM